MADGRAHDVDCLAEAQYLEWSYWDNLRKLLGG